MKLRRIWILIVVLVLAAGCTQTAPADEPSAPTDAPVVEATATELQPTAAATAIVEEATEAPTETETPTEVPATEAAKVIVPQPALIGNYGCDGELRDYQEWCLLYDGVVTSTAVTDLPANARTFPDLYDYSPATNQLLLGLSDWEGVGPEGIFSATDLWLGSHPENLELQPLIDESVVVAAAFSHDGAQIAYLAGTEQTLELHLLDLEADLDRVVAVDVTPSFVFSPDGKQIAFVRDSEWITTGDAFGLYVVSLETGAESMVLIDMTDVYEFTSPLYWSPDGQTILVMVRVINANGDMWKYMVYNLAEGTNREVIFDPTTVNLYSSEMTDLNFVSPLLWAEDGSYFLAEVVTGFMTPEMTSWVLKYNLNPALEMISTIDAVAEHAELVGWDLPGVSVWLKPTDKNELGWPYSVILP